jgi:hypothetical protein
MSRKESILDSCVDSDYRMVQAWTLLLAHMSIATSEELESFNQVLGALKRRSEHGKKPCRDKLYAAMMEWVCSEYDDREEVLDEV